MATQEAVEARAMVIQLRNRLSRRSKHIHESEHFRPFDPQSDCTTPECQDDLSLLELSLRLLEAV